MLEHKGYLGEVVYDDEAEVLHARVINSGPYPIANAEADVEGIKREFRISIDVYLDSCLGRARQAPAHREDGELGLTSNSDMTDRAEYPPPR